MNKNASDQANVRLEESYPHEKRNLIVFALNQILMRLGWMFKAESVVIPAFIDVYTSSGTIRGLLPLILRIGQSLPQFLVAQRVARMPTKTGVLYFHRVRFCHSVVCIVWDIKPNTLVRECHRSCFSCTLYPALARGRLPSSGERNVTRKTHQSRKNGAGYSPIPISSAVHLRSESLFIFYRVGFLETRRVMQCSLVQQPFSLVSQRQSVSGLENSLHSQRAPHPFSNFSVMPFYRCGTTGIFGDLQSLSCYFIRSGPFFHTIRFSESGH